MKPFVTRSILFQAAVSSLLAASAGAVDLRFDVSTSNNAVLLPNLAFPSANGHVGLLGGSTFQSTLTSKGNLLGIYYNDFNANNPFSAYPNPHDMAEVIQGYTNEFWTAPGTNSGWIALNEISSANWQNNPVNSAGYDYHTWCIDIAAILKNGDNSDPNNIIPAHTGVIMWAPFGTPSSANKTSWQALTQYAYIADERYIDGPSAQADGYSVSAVQSFYQTSFNDWVNNAGVPANRLILSEEYTNSASTGTGSGLGASGLSGEAWQAAIETRNLAAYNVGFGGYVGYAWGKNAQGSPTSALISYENAYASTMVVQTEIPCWTGNDGSSSWADYLNWTGGLPSTTQFPYDSLLNNSFNVGVIHQQTAANFLSHANPSAAGTTITLDGNQSITTMTFDSPNPYTIAPGTGGSLTLTGTNASITVVSGSHSITGNVFVNNDLAVNLTGNLTLSGGLTNAHILTKSGTGTLTISGAQSNSIGAAISVTAGTLNLNSDGGSANSMKLALASSGGITNLNSIEHLSSLSITGGSVKLAGQALVTNAIAITGTGALDLTQNSMIFNYTGASPAITIAGYLKSGYNAGAWNGLGINSSTAAADANANTAVGYAEASQLGLDHGGSFAGQTIAGEAVLVKYTYYGDENLDGVVNLDDFSIFVDGFNGLGSGWIYGDFNYDGVVNQADFAMFVQGFDLNGQPLSQLSAAILADQQLSSSQRSAMLSAIPEPATASICLLTGLLVLNRRRCNKSSQI